MTDYRDYVDVGALEDVPERGSRIVKSEGGDIAVFKAADGAIFALRDRCPHKGGPLSQGIVHGHRVTCPLHSWVIELADGRAVAPDVGCAGHYPARLEGGRVSLLLSSVTALARSA